MKALCQRHYGASEPSHLPTSRRLADGRQSQAFPATDRQSNEVPSPRLQLSLRDDLPREYVNIHPAQAENMDAVVSVNYSSVPPGFQTIPLTGYQ